MHTPNNALPDARRRIDKALRDLRKLNHAINVNTVAQRAGVTRKTIYHHKDLLARIRAHTQLAPVSTADDGPGISIIAALRAQLTAKDKDIASLNTTLRERDTTIAMPYGKLEQHTPHQP